jgi:hypothetical protein
VLLALPACAMPPDYSPHYVQVPVVTTDKHHNKVVRYEPVPEACLTPDPTDDQLGPRLPPGCANNANLQMMVERKEDVIHGRKLGAAPASPSARAAAKYIYGTPSTLGGGVGGPSLGTAPPTASSESVPAPASAK